jgi:hypothetical protein
MTQPKTEYIVVRGPGYPEASYIRISKNDGSIDLSQHSLWKIDEVGGKLMEDWVPTSELSIYQQDVEGLK